MLTPLLLLAVSWCAGALTYKCYRSKLQYKRWLLLLIHIFYFGILYKIVQMIALYNYNLGVKETLETIIR
jgi:hypothetical protein